MASLLQPSTKLHRRLPDKIDLPAEAYHVAPSELEEVLDDIAVVGRKDDTEGEPTELEAAIDDIFMDWSE